MAKSLVMVFKSANKDNVTITLNNVKEDLKEAEVMSLMDVILDKNVFEVKGDMLVSKEKAQLVTRNVEVFNI